MKDMKDTERRRPLPDAEADGVIAVSYTHPTASSRAAMR